MTPCADGPRVRQTVAVTPSLGNHGAEDSAATPPQGCSARDTGLCLSGGGYRAMLYHVGALRAMNQLGILPSVGRVSCVSGGSVAGAVLGLNWRHLKFRSDGVAQNFDDVVATPISRFASQTVDWQTALGKATGSANSYFERRMNAFLFHGATLQDLPSDSEGPRFVFCATNVETGNLFRMSKPYMRDYAGPHGDQPTLPLATAVAASASFPPYLAPTRVSCSGQSVVLVDGGVYDNLALEPVLKRYRHIHVSDGGRPFIRFRPRSNWISLGYRTSLLLDSQVRRLRRRQLVDALISGKISGALWRIDRPLPASYRVGSEVDDRHVRLAGIPTRLSAISEASQDELHAWGQDSALTAIMEHCSSAEVARA